jgi:hypothetical protein
MEELQVKTKGSGPNSCQLFVCATVLVIELNYVTNFLSPRALLRSSNPTPRAIIADSTTSLKYQKRQNKNIQLKDHLQ